MKWISGLRHLLLRVWQSFSQSEAHSLSRGSTNRQLGVCPGADAALALLHQRKRGAIASSNSTRKAQSSGDQFVVSRTPCIIFRRLSLTNCRDVGIGFGFVFSCMIGSHAGCEATFRVQLQPAFRFFESDRGLHTFTSSVYALSHLLRFAGC